MVLSSTGNLVLAPISPLASATPGKFNRRNKDSSAHTGKENRKRGELKDRRMELGKMESVG